MVSQAQRFVNVRAIISRWWGLTKYIFSFPLYSCPVVPIVAAVYVYVAHLTAFHL